MPQWTRSPAPDDRQNTMRIVRTPPNKPLTGIITTTDPIGTYTHYANRRTLPCEGIDACPWCAKGYPARWHGYVALILTDTLEHVIFEYTAAASPPIENYLRLNGTIRGAIIQAKRVAPAPNARVVISIKPTDPARTPIPPPPDVKAHLCRIWNIRNDNQQPQYRDETLAKHLSIPPDPTDGRYRPQT